MFDIQDELDSHLDWIENQMSSNIKSLILDARFDLHNGPFGTSDDYPGFETACEILSQWAEENIEPATYEVHWDEENGSEYEVIEGSEEYIRREIFGKELMNYV